MKWTEYQGISTKTAFWAKDKFYDDKLTNLSNNDTLIDRCNRIDMMHACSGIVTEVLELVDALQNEDEVNIQEELCDILWYISLATNILALKHSGLTLYDFSKTEVKWKEEEMNNNMSLDIGYASIMLLDLAKKYMMYPKYYNDDVWSEYLFNLIILIHKIALLHSIDIEQGLTNNIEKLQGVRYKDGLTSENANERDLNSERKALENEKTKEN